MNISVYCIVETLICAWHCPITQDGRGAYAVIGNAVGIEGIATQVITYCSARSVLYGGSWDKPEYKKLVQNKTDLAITSGKLLPLSGETLTERKQTAPADAESLTAVEYRDRLYDLADRFAVLDIPMLIDRSADEADALAQADWLRLYGILFGNETTAERMIREITSREG